MSLLADLAKEIQQDQMAHGLAEHWYKTLWLAYIINPGKSPDPKDIQLETKRLVKEFGNSNKDGNAMLRDVCVAIWRRSIEIADGPRPVEPSAQPEREPSCQNPC